MTFIALPTCAAQRFARFAACALAVVFAGVAAAATAYPDKPIRLLVPFRRAASPTC